MLNGDEFISLVLADRDHKEKGVKKKVGTYTPMTDCFFGGSLLMMATDDLLI